MITADEIEKEYNSLMTELQALAKVNGSTQRTYDSELAFAHGDALRKILISLRDTAVLYQHYTERLKK